MPIRIDPIGIHARSNPRLQTQVRHVSNATLSMKARISAGPVRIDPNRIYTRSNQHLQTQGRPDHMISYIQVFDAQCIGSKWDPNLCRRITTLLSSVMGMGKGKADTTKVMSAILSFWTDYPSDVVVHVWVEAMDSLVEIFHRHRVPYDSIGFPLVLLVR